MHKIKHLHAKLFFVSTFFLLNCASPLSILSDPPPVAPPAIVRENLKKHVFTLASDSLQGREAGTIYARKAADYIARYWEKFGLEFFVRNTFLQPFGFNGFWGMDEFQNVVGVIRGSDPVLRNEYIVVGAHFDHLGVCSWTGAIYSGADDNASGTAALIELARVLKESKSSFKRSIILIGFDAEETGLIGSTYFARTFSTIAPNGRIALMFSLDMVGWYEANGAVEYVGTGTIRNGCALILNEQFISDGLNAVAVEFETSLLFATDTEPFAVRGIPTLHVFTGTESPIHTPEDESHLIDFDGMVLITEHLRNLIEFIAQDTEFASSGQVAPIHRR
jgi:hypothetical protein